MHKKEHLHVIRTTDFGVIGQSVSMAVGLGDSRKKQLTQLYKLSTLTKDGVGV